MNRDEIIRCAMDWYDSGAEVREEFEAMIGVLVDSAERLEREACADDAETFLNTVTNASMASDCADSIRARSNKGE